MTDLKNIIMTKEQMAAYIDKTAVLKKWLEAVPSIYIEGAAASGKTIAARMLISGNRPASCFWHDFSMEKARSAVEILDEAVSGKYDLFVFDRVDLCGDGQFYKNLGNLIRGSEEKKIILISREKPDDNLVRLIWEDRMRIIPQEFLSFTLDDIRTLGRQRGVFVNPKEFLEESGGWPGCVSLCMHLLAGLQEYGKEKAQETVNEGISRAHPVRSRVFRRIRHRYEIESFIDGEILGSLSEDGQRIMQCAVGCDWVSENMCQDCLEVKKSGDLLEDLSRKGLLRKAGESRYKAANLFKSQKLNREQPWKSYSIWYEDNGCIKEAYSCLYRYAFETQKQPMSSGIKGTAEDEKKAEMDAFLFAHYDRIPFLGEDYSFVLEDERNDYQIVYLRGMCRYQKQDFEGLRNELKKVSRLKGHEGQEVYLNLLYVDVYTTAREFIEQCHRIYSSGKGKKFRLFPAAGNPFNCLCGQRDLSSLFACKKRTEDVYAGIWQSVFGRTECDFYSMARLEYYIETNRTSQIQEEILQLQEEASARESYSQMELYRLLLLCQLQKKSRGEELSERILELREALQKSYDEITADLSDAVYGIYGAERNRMDLVSEWVRRHDDLLMDKLNENNYYMFFILLKGLVLLGRYDKTSGLLARLAEYLMAFRRHKLLSEILFIQAIVRFQMGEKGTALRSTIESFAEGGAFRYVRFYTDYGNAGKQVLEQFAEWHEAQNPDNWKRKRKYDYRSVLNMPESDYLYLVAKAAGRDNHPSSNKHLPETERLTVTEMVVMQSLSRGMTNEQIAEELNLKVTTVKSHLYSIYKKLGVKSRMEAVVRAGEMKVL